MNNFRNVNDDILKEWLNFREETDLVLLMMKIESILLNLIISLKRF